MATKTKLYAHASLAPTLALAMLLLIGTVASGQTSPPTPMPTNPPTSTPPPRGDDDITRQEVANMDWFMDRHPEIAEQLRKDPSLIDNRKWMADHPALQEFLENHPGVREEFKENPNAFMRQEERYDRQEGDRDHDRDRISAGDRDRRGDPDGRGELTSFGQFLGGHSTVAAELSKDPSLVNNKEYMASHPELGEYLKAHPAMSQQLAENPQAVMSSNWVQQGSGMGAKTPPPKPKVNPNQ